jgi:hypothetical protein
MKDLRHIPTAKGKREITLVIFLAFVATLLFAFSVSGLFSRSVLQLLFLVLVCTDILLCIRYFLTTFQYTVTDEYGEAMLIVTQTQGKRISTLANFKLKDIRKIEIASDKNSVNELKKRFNSQKNRFSYAPSIVANELTCLTVKSDYTAYLVMLETDSRFSSALKQIIDSIPKNDEE